MYKKKEENISELEKLIPKHDYSLWTEILFLFVVIAGIFSIYLLTNNIADSDSLYHIRHAWLYRTGNPFDSSFPWHQFSVVKDAASDLWYGFHILLIPFTYFNDLLVGIKISGIALSILLVFSLHYLFRKIKVWQPALWVLFFFTATIDIFYRMTTNRPHVVSMALIVLLFLFSSQVYQKRKWLILLISSLISFIHLAVAWIIPLVVFVAIMWEKIVLHKDELILARFRAIFKTAIIGTMPAILGIIIGFLLRPNPLGALKLFYVQTFEIIFAKMAGQVLPFGFELEKLDFFSIFAAGIFFVAVFASLITFINLYDKKQSLFFKRSVPIILSSLTLYFFFLALSVLVARRAMDFVFFFGIVLISIIFSEYINSRQKNLRMKIEKAGVILIILIFGVYNMTVTFGYKKDYAHRPDVFKNAALWLENNSNKGDIVAHFNFLDSPKLFFWNQKNYYITGFDPIFQYSFDKKLYSYLEFSKFADVPAWFGKKDSNYIVQQYIITASLTRQKNIAELHHHLISDFKAKYLFMEKKFFPTFIKSLDNSGLGFKKVFESDGEIIYKVETVSK